MTPIQQKIEEYREFLNEKTFLGEVLGNTSERSQAIKHAVAVLSEEFHRLFPEDTQTSDHLDKIPGMHEEHSVDEDIDNGPLPEPDYSDETDSLYPRTQPHSFPPR